MRFLRTATLPAQPPTNCRREAREQRAESGAMNTGFTNPKPHDRNMFRRRELRTQVIQGEDQIACVASGDSA
jgi:hypothetical protein